MVWKRYSRFLKLREELFEKVCETPSCNQLKIIVQIAEISTLLGGSRYLR